MSGIKHAERQLANSAQRYNAFISRVSRTQCLSAVNAASLQGPAAPPNNGVSGRLFAVKDNICTCDLPTTCASEALRDFKSPFDATVVDLVRKAGGVIVGKTNLDEFGMGSHNLNSAFGAPINPVGTSNEILSTGGSSGGSAAAVASDSCHAALGTDTGGSVRLPAAYCQVVGFKPSYGRVSRFGVVAYANSLDTVGIIANRVEHVRDLFSVVDSPDDRDPTCLKQDEREQIQSVQQERGDGKLRIGIPEEFNIRELHGGIREAWAAVAELLMEQGHMVVPVKLPAVKAALAAYYVLAPAEASSNLAKYDGIRYGNPSTSSRSKSDVLFARTRSEKLGAEVRRRILLGSFSLSSMAMDNYFVQAQKVRRQVQEAFNAVFRARHPFMSDGFAGTTQGVDLLLTPTAPTSAPSAEKVKSRSSLMGYRDDVFTVPASLAGLPALSLPYRAYQERRPFSVQLTAQYGDDDFVLREGAKIESLLSQNEILA